MQMLTPERSVPVQIAARPRAGQRRKDNSRLHVGMGPHGVLHRMSRCMHEEHLADVDRFLLQGGAEVEVSSLDALMPRRAPTR